MSNQFLNSLTSAATTTAYSYPADGSVSAGQGFKAFFKNLFSVFQLGGGYNQAAPSTYGYNPNQQAINSFQSARNNNVNGKRLALAPGSSRVNLNAPEQENIPQGFNQYQTNPAFLGGVNQFQPLSGGGFNGLPNAQFQGGFNSPAQAISGLNPGAVSPFTQGQFPQGTNPAFPITQTNAPGGLLPILIAPIVGIFTLIGSLFKIKKASGGFLKPVEISTNTTFDQYGNYLNDIDRNNAGAFYEPDEFEPQRLYEQYGNYNADEEFNFNELGNDINRLNYF